ncbi:DUF1679 domain-containing protein [Mycobacterium sp. NBC_00419]|uniref:oxidoreductase family protein n=1 Tax=Mycobacterium sp. NBC_00419 TaxID=2975989 RepID=UPI002E1DFD60
MSIHSAAIHHQDRASARYLGQRIASVTGFWLSDVIRRRPVVGTLPDIPTRPEQLTCSWLTEALRKDVPGAEVIAFSCPQRHGGTTMRFSLCVQWNDKGQQAGLPTQMFVKTTDSWQQRLMLGLTGMLSGESTFYSRLRPELDIEAPNGYYGAYDERSCRSITVMEDVAATRGARFLTPVDASDRAGMEDVLGDLAAMHGRFWAGPELASNGLRDSFGLISWTDSLVNFRSRSHVGVKRANRVIPDEIAGRTDEIYDANLRTIEIDRVMASTLLHGDGHAGQRYRTNAGRTGLSDWQVIHRGHWAWDVAYTMITALSVEDRRAWERDLIAHYLERLAQAGGDAPDFDQAWLEYRRHCFQPYIAWVFTLGRAAYHPNWQPDEYCLAIIERAGQAIVDLDGFGALASAADR